MGRSLYDAGGMMRAAANIRCSMKNFNTQRKKIDDAGADIEIKTIYGFGYKMVEKE